MTPRVFCGSFEAEAHWREPDLARLLSVPDQNAARIVEAMDEMLFAFTGRGDRLITGRRMDDAHVEYLHALGFRFERNQFDVLPPEETGDSEATAIAPSIFQHLDDDRLSHLLMKLLPDGARLEPFAVLPRTTEVARRYGLSGVFPTQEVIRSVNTKSYSLHMRDRLGIANVGVLVDDVTLFAERGAELLRGGPFLVKDDYGVSGKGNQLIETERGLRRIARHLTGQLTRGKRIRFVLEPYLPKRSDFSCQFCIADDGAVRVVSVQELLNRGLAFGASCSAPPQLLERLERAGYFGLIQELGSLMYRDGYWGDVCVDSMILEDGELAPLVEINARKSMSLIKHAMDRYLATMDREGCLTYLSVVHDSSTDFSGLLEGLERESLLFTTERGRGILPMTSGTLYVRSAAERNIAVRGRLYIVPVCEKSADRGELLAATARVMEQVGLRVKH